MSISIDATTSAHANSNHATLPLRLIVHRAVYKAARRVVGCRPHVPCASAVSPSPPGAVNIKPLAVAVYIALADSRYAVAKFLSPQSLGQSSGGKYSCFRRYPNFPKIQRSIGRGKRVRKNQLDLWSRFDTIPACDSDTQTHRHMTTTPNTRASVTLRR